MPAMARLQRRRFDERVIGKLVWDPGWRWSVDVKPIAGTQYCQSHHVGYCVSGRLRVQMNDGVELEIGPDEVFEIPPGHDAWVLGDEPFVTIDFEAMRGFARANADTGRRTLASILMTDIVESTVRAVALGPARWQEVVRRHNELAERAIDQHDGRLVKTTGDGVVGLFNSAEQAVRAASAISVGVRSLDIAVRAAVNTGEVEQTAGDARGVAVHAVARMMALAQADEIVISATVHDLLDGTGLEFEDFGLHELKGLPGQRQLFRMRPIKPQLRGYE
jgi:class 3 adenylate cyclase